MSLFTRSPEDRYGPALLRQTPTGVAVYRLEASGEPGSLRLTYLNEAGERLSGLSASREQGRRIDDVLDATGDEVATLARVAESGEPVHMGLVEYGDHRIARATFECWAVPLPDRSVALLFQSGTSVADRAAADLESARTESFVEATGATLWQTPPSGRFETAQPSWEALTGQTQDELAGWGWLDAVHPDDRLLTQEVWAEAVRTASPYRVEHRIRQADGSYRLMRARAVPRLAGGEIAEWIGVHTDVEAVHDAANAVAAGEARFDALLNAISDVLLVYPFDPVAPGPLLAFNQAAVQLYGYDAATLRQTRIQDLVDQEQLDLARAMDELRRSRHARFDSVHLTRDGRRVPMQVSARLVEFDGQLCVVSVCRDDTEQRAFRRTLSRTNLQLERRVEERTAQLEAFTEDLKLLHGITTADHASPAERTRAYLEAGCAMFEMPIGILSHVATEPETGETQYRIESVVSPGDAVPPGLTIPLRDAFCDAVVSEEDTITYADAATHEQLACHSAYAERGLRSFIGTPIWDGDVLVGTLNFVSPEPRDRDFASYERELVEVMADAIGRRARQERAEAERAEASQWYRSVVETVGEGLVLVDGAGLVLHANPAGRALLGLAGAGERAPARRAGWAAVGPDGQPLAADALPEARALRDGTSVRGDVQGIVRPDGTTRWYAVNATPLDRDGDGAPDVAVLSFSDVTALRPDLGGPAAS